jgi:WD40 repeat protein
MGLRVFVSYARDDRLHVRHLVEILTEGGHDPWFDHRILPGQDWKAELSKAIRLCDVFLYAITPRSVKSEWCRWEFQEAMTFGKRVMPVIFEATSDLPPPLDRFQHADFTQGVILGTALKLVAGMWEFAFQMQANLHLPDQLSGVPSRVVITRPTINRNSSDHVGELRALPGHSEPVQSISFNADSNLLASASWDNTVRLWEIPTGRFLMENRSHFDDVLSVAFSPVDDELISGARDRTISIWNVNRRFDRPSVLRGHTGAVTCVEYSPDGENIVSGGATSTPVTDCTVRLWDEAQRLSTVLYTHTQTVTGIAFSANDRFLASSSDDNTIWLNDQTSRKSKFKLLKGHNAAVKSVAFSPDGLLLASGGRDCLVRIWRVLDGGELVSLQGHAETVTSVAFSHDGTVLASASKDRTIRLWEIPTGKLLITLTGHTDSINAIRFSPDGAYLASASRDHTVRLWGVKERKTGEIRRITNTKPIKPIKI